MHVCYIVHGVTHQKVLIFVFIAVDTSNLMTDMFVIFECTEKLIIPQWNLLNSIMKTFDRYTYIVAVYCIFLICVYYVLHVVYRVAV